MSRFLLCLRLCCAGIGYHQKGEQNILSVFQTVLGWMKMARSNLIHAMCELRNVCPVELVGMECVKVKSMCVCMTAFDSIEIVAI